MRRTTVAIYFALSITALCVLHAGQASPLVDNATTSRERRAANAKCRFQCLSGDCLEDDKYECDGIKDCADGSDETDKACQVMDCPDYLFRCDYGACVDADARCNGIMDCADSSDEKNCGNMKKINVCTREEFKCGTGSCILSTEQCDGKSDCKDGSDETAALCQHFPCQPYSFRCDYGGCIDKSGFCNGVAQCADGSDEKPTACRRPNASSPSPEVITSSPPKVTPSTSKPVGLKKGNNFLCDPEEDLPTPKHSDCGHRPAGIPFIRHGFTANREDFPWNAAVYKIVNGTYILICSGSLVSPRLVISAAHCFWNSDTWNLDPAGNYKIALGKIKAAWNESEEGAEKFSVERIVINCFYKHSLRQYDDDIAAVYLKGEVSFSNTIYPICIDWDKKHNHGVDSGEVPGFGLTENDVTSDVLKKVTLRLVNTEECEGTLSLRSTSYLSRRKFCAGFRNNTGVCNGDSGGGLVFLNEENELWYLRGIVSSGLSRGRNSNYCSKEHYGFFTDVYQFIPWLKKVYST